MALQVGMPFRHRGICEARDGVIQSNLTTAQYGPSRQPSTELNVSSDYSFSSDALQQKFSYNICNLETRDDLQPVSVVHIHIYISRLRWGDRRLEGHTIEICVRL
jgi:hypothetical protein